MDSDFPDTFFRQVMGNAVCHVLRVAVHRAESDNDAGVGFVFAPFVVFSDDVADV